MVRLKRLHERDHRRFALRRHPGALAGPDQFLTPGPELGGRVYAGVRHTPFLSLTRKPMSGSYWIVRGFPFW